MFDPALREKLIHAAGKAAEYRDEQGRRVVPYAVAAAVLDALLEQIDEAGFVDRGGNLHIHYDNDARRGGEHALCRPVFRFRLLETQEAPR